MEKTKTKQTGWILRNIQTGRYLAGRGRYDSTTKLGNAAVFNTRTEARNLHFLGKETVYHVALSGSTPTKIIAGNGSNCRF